ncbi:MAG TPA: SPOR domain-containing protein [Burkholderiales bacterium]|nr:SPOR domain-containing protein [Burkholderiales bacterium]
MKRIHAVLFGAGLALGAAQSLAAPAAVVEGVQMPAWVEHDGVRTPLAPGMTLVAGDQVSTGADSRLLVKLAEGSRVKLGANATLAITAMQPDRGGLFSAALHVLEGAFRFTTEALAKARRREVSITLNTVTAGIRGTDLWGRSTEDKQIVCLIEGKIEVKPENENALTMDRPLEFYQREHGKSLPVGQVSPEQLAKWAAETEIEKGAGAALRGGKWKLTLASTRTQGEALDLYGALRAAGYPARIYPGMSHGKRVYRVRITQLPSKAEAEALAGRLRGKLGVAEPKVSL